MNGSSASADREALTRALDAVPSGLLFVDRSGRIVRRNRTLSRMLKEPDGTHLQASIDTFSSQLRELVAGGRTQGPGRVEELAVREIRTSAGWYRLRGSYIGQDLLGEGEAFLVCVEPTGGAPLSDDTLREHFQLTRTEVRIARLLAEGKSNAQLAAMLHISPHTARTHTERVLRKLGIRSRAEVGPRIQRG